MLAHLKTPKFNEETAKEKLHWPVQSWSRRLCHLHQCSQELADQGFCHKFEWCHQRNTRLTEILCNLSNEVTHLAGSRTDNDSFTGLWKIIDNNDYSNDYPPPSTNSGKSGARSSSNHLRFSDLHETKVGGESRDSKETKSWRFGQSGCLQLPDNHDHSGANDGDRWWWILPW